MSDKLRVVNWIDISTFDIGVEHDAATSSGLPDCAKLGAGGTLEHKEDGMLRHMALLGLLAISGCGSGELAKGQICKRNGDCASGECLIVDLTVSNSCKRCAGAPCSAANPCSAGAVCHSQRST